MWGDLDPRSMDDRARESSDPRAAGSRDPRDVFAEGLDLPHGPDRERVHERGHDYDLRGSEVRALATIGAFRVVAVDDLRDERGRSLDIWQGDLERLKTAGLVQIVAPLDRSERTSAVTLTDHGRQLLEHHRNTDREPHQRYYAGVLRARELSHDTQLFRAYVKSAERLCAEGARIQRVVLDYELKREYQQFLQARNRDRSDSDGRPDRSREEVQRWADEHRLPVLEDRVQFPDVRIEYERADGRRDIEDVEVTTPHYRGAHAAAKARAGFTRFRGTGGRVGGRTGRSGGRSGSDPGLAEELLE